MFLRVFTNNQKLFSAIEANDVQTAQGIINSGGFDRDYVSPKSNGDSLLVYAINNCHMRIARALINAGANVNFNLGNTADEKNSEKTPLRFAIMYEMMLASPRGSAIEKADIQAANGLVALLLEKGAKPVSSLKYIFTAPIQGKRMVAKRNELFRLMVKAGVTEEDIEEKYKEQFQELMTELYKEWHPLILTPAFFAANDTNALAEQKCDPFSALLPIITGFSSAAPIPDRKLRAIVDVTRGTQFYKNHMQQAKLTASTLASSPPASLFSSPINPKKRKADVLDTDQDSAPIAKKPNKATVSGDADEKMRDDENMIVWRCTIL